MLIVKIEEIKRNKLIFLLVIELSINYQYIILYYLGTLELIYFDFISNISLPN